MSLFRKPSDPNALPSIFPTYLLPSVPFRRKSRQSSTDSNDSTFSATSTLSTVSSSSSASNPFIRSPTPVPASSSSSVILPPDTKLLNGHTSRIHCARCSTDLCLTSQIISKGFTGRHGRAFLVQGTPSHIHHTRSPPPLPNTYQNKPVPRNLVTGQHTVSDISCAICDSILGWKYVEASEESQKYKVGKYILETKKIRVGVEWENEEGKDGDMDAYEDVITLPPNELRNLRDGGGGSAAGEDLEFDSQDEDECEDLFAGVWSPQLASKRRKRKNERFGGRRSRTASDGLSGLGSRSEDTLS